MEKPRLPELLTSCSLSDVCAPALLLEVGRPIIAALSLKGTILDQKDIIRLGTQGSLQSRGAFQSFSARSPGLSSL